ncbi:hypothetical protein DFS33DRAFT_189777 [Desarmillaria ectypa]|nr:hypothetical protein DFS33DRAFT_189777 [Desarmillaria ectypa]
MSACNHAISSARTTIESLFSFKAVTGLGITFPFKFSAQEETQITVATPPPIPRSRAKFSLNSSSLDSQPLSSFSTSPISRSHSSRSRLYRGIGLGHPSSKGVPPSEVAMPASKRGVVSDHGVFPKNSGGKLASPISGSDFKQYAGLGLGAPPMRNRGVIRSHLGSSPCRSENDTTLDVPCISPANLGRFPPTNSVPKRCSRKDSAGLGFAHPTSNSLRTPSPPPPPSKSSGIGMLTSSLSISSELCRLTSQSSLQPPPRSQPQPRARAHRLFSSKMAFVTLSKFSKRSLYTIPESSTGSPDLRHGSFIGKGGRRNVGKAFEGNAVHSFGQTLF